MTLGNAGGVDLTLNGADVGSVGSRGQVVKVKLPRNAVKEEPKPVNGGSVGN